ncbi:MAG: hypothetical protein KDM64_15070, partial [Verrucomicrobiae bacterium]|nr:hypothetical protein [Verrucomicrobiae bacterium]
MIPRKLITVLIVIALKWIQNSNDHPSSAIVPEATSPSPAARTEVTTLMNPVPKSTHDSIEVSEATEAQESDDARTELAEEFWK